MQWRSHQGVKVGQSAPWQRKYLPKIRKKRGKNQGKLGRKGKNQEDSFTLPLLTDRAAWLCYWLCVFIPPHTLISSSPSLITFFSLPPFLYPFPFPRPDSGFVKRGGRVPVKRGRVANIAPKPAEFAWFSCQKGGGRCRFGPYLDPPLHSPSYTHFKSGLITI